MKAQFQPMAKTGEALGIAGLTLGIVGLAYMIVNWFLNLPLFIVGLIFSIIQQRRKKTKIGLAALIINIVGIVLSIVLLIVVIIYIMPLMAQFQQTGALPTA